MSDFRSKLKEIMLSSFGETEKQYSNKNSPNQKIQVSTPFGNQLGNLDQSIKNKWRIDISLDHFRKSRTPIGRKVVTSMKNRDLFAKDNSRDKFTNFLKLENDSNSKLNISNSLNSKLDMKNLLRSKEPTPVASLMERLNFPEEVTSKSKGLLELHKVRGISKSYTNHMLLEENFLQLNKTREHSMNSTAIGSILGDHQTLTNSKLMKEIHSYSDNLKDALKKGQQKPALSLNIPLFQMDRKSFLEFSPINVRKNYLVTGARPKPMTKPSSSGFFNMTRKVSKDFSSLKFSSQKPYDLGLSTLLKKSNFRAKTNERNLFDSNLFDDDPRKC